MSVSVMAKVWPLDLDPTAKLILLKLADCANDDGRNAWPSVERMAHECCIHRRTVQRTLRRLTDAGLIAVEREATQHRPAAYILHPLRGVKLPPLPKIRGGTASRPGAASDPPGAAYDPARGGAAPPDPSVIHQNNHQENHPPLTPPLARGGSAERARAGSRRRRDVEALEARGESRYFTGKYGAALKERLQEA